VRIGLSSGKLDLQASSPDQGEAKESISVPYKGASLEIAFNAQYLIEFLAAAGTEEITLELKDAESQGLLKPVGGGDTDYRYVVMPMRL
jgi:DNA polymerase-3 subunit beta